MFYGNEPPNDTTDEESTALATTYPPLAWDKHGKRFHVPHDAAGWRVQEKPDKRGGRATQVFTPEGPLHLAINASYDALAEAVDFKAGWYVLSLVDKTTRILPNTTNAHVHVVTRRHESDEHDDRTGTMEQLCTTIQQLALYSVRRDEAICTALTQCTAALSDIQRSTAEILRAATSSLDIAAGAALPKLPPPPPLPELPPPPPQKNLVDFLSSPAGTTTVAALANVVTSITGSKK